MSLDDFWDRATNIENELRATAALLRELVKAAVQVAEVVSLGYIAEAVGASVGAQKLLDITVNELR